MQHKDIPGHEGYKATDGGDIIGPRGNKLKPRPDRYGYPSVSISDNSRTGRSKRGVHVLVALAWHGARPAGMDCAHLDGNKQNNSPDNLRWMTRRENHLMKRQHGTQPSGKSANGTGHSLEKSMVAHAAALAGLSKRVIAAALGISMTKVSGLRTGRIGITGSYSALNPNWKPRRKPRTKEII